jgi:hypothetical protein
VERLLTFTDSVNIYPRLTEEEEVVELTSEQQTYKVNGDILSYIEKLDDLLIRHLQVNVIIKNIIIVKLTNIIYINFTFIVNITFIINYYNIFIIIYCFHYISNKLF